MITDLEIANFQSHKNTSLSFHPGVNVVVGQSDTGKSSIIRAINWVISNRPSGDSFRANFSKSDTEVAMAFGEDFVLRKKGKSTNSYEVESGKLKALRTDVPQEVKDVTLMKEVNIQPQHKSYFLLDETPGNVAKAFNTVSGLEEMDAALKNINSKVRDTSSKISHTSEKIDQLEIDIEKVKWVGEAEKSLKWIEEYNQTVIDFKIVIDALRSRITEVRRLSGCLKELPDFSALPKIKEISKLDTDINTKLEHSNYVFDIVSSLSELRKKEKVCSAIQDLDVSSSAELSKRINAKINEFDALKTMIRRIEREMNVVSIAKNEVDVWKREFDDLESQLEICPTCGQIIKEES